MTGPDRPTVPTFEPVLAALGGPIVRPDEPAATITAPLLSTLPRSRPSIVVADHATLPAYHRLRRKHFVETQRLFDHSDLDDIDESPSTIVLVATDGPAVVGGVRLHPIGSAMQGWWLGSRLITTPNAPPGTGTALVRAACARAVDEGALRFDATVQHDRQSFFERLGWEPRSRTSLGGIAHVEMSWPVERFQSATASKSPIGRLVGAVQPGGHRWLGDDARYVLRDPPAEFPKYPTSLKSGEPFPNDPQFPVVWRA